MTVQQITSLIPKINLEDPLILGKMGFTIGESGFYVYEDDEVNCEGCKHWIFPGGVGGIIGIRLSQFDAPIRKMYCSAVNCQKDMVDKYFNKPLLTTGNAPIKPVDVPYKVYKPVESGVPGEPVPTTAPPTKDICHC